jgi:hypothetical protein
LRASPLGQTGQGRFKHGHERLNTVVSTGFTFLNGWRSERPAFGSCALFPLLRDDLEDDDELDAFAEVPGLWEAELLKLWLLADAEPPEAPL